MSCMHVHVHVFLFASIIVQLLVFLQLVGSNINAKVVPAIIVFGDSSVDAGNNNAISTVLRSNFQPYGRDFVGGRPTGRFSNGRIPPDFISQGFGLKPIVPAYLDPMYNISDFATGVCFASAGTGYDNATSNVLNVIPMWKEIKYYKEYQQKLRAYLGDEAADNIITNSLYILSLGTNDFLENYYGGGGRRSQFTIQQFEDFLVTLAEGIIFNLYTLGARKVSFTGVPPMGCLPLERTTNFVGRNDCVQDYNVVARDFNAKLAVMVDRLNRGLPGLNMVFSNPYDQFYDIITKPASYGFEVARRACCATGLYEMSYMCNKESPFTCTDASKFVFWDSFHPSERTNQILAQNLLQTLLLPTFSN